LFDDASDVFDAVSDNIYTDECGHFDTSLANGLLADRIAQAVVGAADAR
jgi:hypothetical protein